MFSRYFRFQLSFLNIAFLMLVLIGSFSWSSLALAFDDDGTWASGYYYSSTSVGPTASASCLSGRITTYGGVSYCHLDASFDYYPNPALASEYRSVNKIACSSYQLKNNIYGCGLTPDPVNDCPEYGESKLVSKLINGRIEGDVFIPENDRSDETYITIGGGAVVDGCSYAVPMGDNIPDGFPSYSGDPITCKTNDAGQVMCYSHEYMISTGELGEAGEHDAPALTEDSDLKPAEGGSTNLLDSEEIRMVGDASTVEEYEGVSTTTQTTVETLVKDKGAQVLDSDFTTVVTMSDGIQKSVTTTTTTVEYPDGSRDVITETETRYTQTDKTNFIINKDTGVISISSTDGSTAGSTKKTTENYDADGNLTGSSTDTSVDGAGEALEEQEAEECAEDDKNCKPKEYDGPEDGGLYTPVGDMTYDSVISGFKSRMAETEIMQSVNGFFDVNISGSCPVWNVNVWVFNIVIDQFCDPIMKDILNYIVAPILLLVAGWFAFRVAILD